MSDLCGTQVGNIRLHELLGRGGMGEVYAGFDVKLERKVAVKAIRREHRLDDEAKARLLREARALSKLDHPHICRIYDYIEGGEGEDRDLLVLELIVGRSLKQAMAAGLGQQEGLAIAEQIMQVLEAAHAANIVHRDLKPENVMLTATGEVKVLDFGIARSLDDEVTATVRLHQSREAELPAVRDAEATHAFTDRPAAHEGGSDPSALLRTKVGSVLGTVVYMSPEQARGEVVAAASDMYSFGLVLQELLTGRPPMDTGLAPHELLLRAARGETVEVSGIDRDLMALINRLKSRSPQARPTATDTLEKLRWIRGKTRRRWRRLAMLAVTLAVIGAGAKYTFDLRRERNFAVAARQAEEQARIESEEALSFLIDVFQVSDPGEARGSTVTARELLDRGAERIRSELAEQPLPRARLLSAIGVVYRKLGLYRQSVELLEEALRIRQEELTGSDLLLAASINDLASLYLEVGRLEEAAALFERCITIIEEHPQTERSELAGRLNNLATVYRRLRRFDEAERLYRRSLVLKEEELGPEHVSVASTLHNLANLCVRQDRFSEAERLCRRALKLREQGLPENHPDLAASLSLLAHICWELDRTAEAEQLHKRALAIQEKTLGPDHPQLGRSINNLAALLSERKPAEAEELYRRAMAIFVQAYGPRHQLVAYPLLGLGNICRDLGRPAEAEEYYRRSLALLESNLPADHPDLLLAVESLATLLRARGNVQEAAALETRLPVDAE